MGAHSNTQYNKRRAADLIERTRRDMDRLQRQGNSRAASNRGHELRVFRALARTIRHGLDGFAI